MDTFALVAAERRRLADELEDLSASDWEQPSLCGEWTTHEVAAHLNVPFTLTNVAFLVGFAKAFGSFDRANARFATELAERMSPAACIENLRANADHHFTPPGFGPEAPLTDTVVHGIDILRPVGRSVDVAPEAFAVILPFLLSRKAQRAFGAVASHELQIAPDDVDLVLGDGTQQVTGPAVALAGALTGRVACLESLDGPGAELLRGRAAAGA